MTIDAGNGVRDYYFGETPLTITDNFSNLVYNTGFFVYIANGRADYYIGELSSMIDRFSILIGFSFSESVSSSDVFNIYTRIGFSENQSSIDLIAQLRIFVQYAEQVSLIDVIHNLQIYMKESEIITPSSNFYLSLRVDFFESQTSTDLFKALSLFIGYSETSTMNDIFKINSLLVKYSDSLSVTDIARLKTFQSFAESLTESEIYLFKQFLLFREFISQTDVFKVDVVYLRYSETFPIRDKVTIQADVNYREILSALTDKYSISLGIKFDEQVSLTDALKNLSLYVSHAESLAALEEHYIAFSDLHLIVAGGIADYFIGEQDFPLDLFKQVSLFLSHSESVSAQDVVNFKAFVSYVESISEVDVYNIESFIKFAESLNLIDVFKSVSLKTSYTESIGITDVAEFKTFLKFSDSITESDRFNFALFLRYSESFSTTDVFRVVSLTTRYSEVFNPLDVVELKAFEAFAETITESDRFNLASFLRFSESVSAVDVFKNVQLYVTNKEVISPLDIAYVAFSDLHLIIAGGIADYFIGEQEFLIDVMKIVNLKTSYSDVISFIDVAELKAFIEFEETITESDKYNFEVFSSFAESLSLTDVFKSVSLSIVKTQTIPTTDRMSVFIRGIEFSDSLSAVDVAELKAFVEFYESLSGTDRFVVDKVFTQYLEDENARDVYLIQWINTDSDEFTIIDKIEFLLLERASDSLSGLDKLNFSLYVQYLESLTLVDVAKLYVSNVGVIVGNGSQDYFITDIFTTLDVFKSAALKVQYSDAFSFVDVLEARLNLSYSDSLSGLDFFNVDVDTQFSELFAIRNKFNVSLQDRYTDILDVLADKVYIVTGLYFSDDFSSIIDEIKFLWTLSTSEEFNPIDEIYSKLEIPFSELEATNSDFTIAFSLEGVIVGNGNQVDFIGEIASLTEELEFLLKIKFDELVSLIDIFILKNFSTYSETVSLVETSLETFKEAPVDSLRMYDGWLIFYPLDFLEITSFSDVFQTALKTKFSDGVIQTESFKIHSSQSFFENIPVVREFYHYALSVGFDESISATDLFEILSKETISEVISTTTSINFVLGQLISELFVLLDNFKVFIQINFNERISALDVYNRFSKLRFTELQSYSDKFRPKFVLVKSESETLSDVENDKLLLDAEESNVMIDRLRTYSTLTLSDELLHIEKVNASFFTLIQDSANASDLERVEFVFDEHEKSGWHDPIQVNLSVSYLEGHGIVDRISVSAIYPYYQQIISLFNAYGFSDVVLVRDMKSVDYSRETPVIIIPKEFEVKEVFNGYVTDINFEVIIATPSETQFAQLKAGMQRVISNSSFSYNLPLIKVISQNYDPNPKGLYREFYILSVKSYQPKVVV